MSVLVTADLHFSDNPRDQYRFDFMRDLEMLINEKKPSKLLILGDLTEKKDFHSSVLVNMVCDAFERLAAFCSVYILRGNHDGLDPAWPFFEFLQILSDRITFIKQPMEFRWEDMGRCLFLPHTTNYKKDWSNYISRDFDGYNFVFAHNTFKGTVSESGKELDGIPTSIFPRGVNVYAGDIHKPQRVGNRVEYVGSPYTVDFGDDYDPRVLLLERLEFGCNSEIVIRCEGNQKRLVESCVVDTGGILYNAHHVNPYDVLKVRVALTREQYADWPTYKDEVMKWGEDNCYRIHMVQPVVEGTKTKKALKHREDSGSNREILEDYGKHTGIDTATMKTGLRILERG